MNHERRALAAVSHNGFVYAIGGVNQNGAYVRETEYSRIDKNGNLSPWRLTSKLKQARFYLAAVALDGYIYALGGGTGPLGDNNQPIATVERAKIKANGSLAPWHTVSHMVTPRRGLKAVIYNRTLYAIGGYNGQFLKTVERTEIDTLGNPGQWVTEKNESIVDRYIHSATLSEQNIILLGGHMRNPDTVSYGDVEIAKIGHEQSLGAWRISNTSLLSPRFMAAAISVGHHIYIIGGHNGSKRLSSVEFAGINPFGELTPWQITSPLSKQRSAAAVVSYEDRILVLGGIGTDTVWNSVEMIRKLPDGTLVHPDK